MEWLIKMTDLHVLTLSWNGLDKLKRLKPTLDANLNYLYDKTGIESQWYIRDNGSKDGTFTEIETWMHNGFYIESYNIGHNKHNFSQGMNYLFERTNAINVHIKNDDLILLLNNDVVFNDNTSLTNMVKLMTNDVGVVGAKLLYTGTNKLQHAGIIYSNKYGGNPWNYRSGEIDDVNASKNRYFQGVTGAVLLTKKSIYSEVNGLSEDLNWAFDDCDFCMKVLQLNKKIAYCGDTNISHDESFSLKRNPVNTLYLNQNLKIFRNRWFGKYQIDHDLYLKDNNYNLIL